MVGLILDPKATSGRVEVSSPVPEIYGMLILRQFSDVTLRCKQLI